MKIGYRITCVNCRSANVNPFNTTARFYGLGYCVDCGMITPIGKENVEEVEIE